MIPDASSTHLPPLVYDIHHSEDSAYIASDSQYAKRIKIKFACRYDSFIVVLDTSDNHEDVYGIYPEDKSIPLAQRRVQILREGSYKKLPLVSYESFSDVSREKMPGIDRPPGCGCILL